MSNKEIFLRFCGVCLTVLVLSIPLLKFVIVPRVGDGIVYVFVASAILIWLYFFFRYGPILGHWDDTPL